MCLKYNALAVIHAPVAQGSFSAKRLPGRKNECDGLFKSEPNMCHNVFEHTRPRDGVRVGSRGSHEIIYVRTFPNLSSNFRDGPTGLT